MENDVYEGRQGRDAGLDVAEPPAHLQEACLLRLPFGLSPGRGDALFPTDWIMHIC
jgi:hypothetical protein